jgi:predicted exporter
MRQTVDPAWIRKTAITALLLALPAVVLLMQIYRSNRQKTLKQVKPLAFWIGVSTLISYCGWAINIMLWQSVGFAVAWPLLGALLPWLGLYFHLQPLVQND